MNANRFLRRIISSVAITACLSALPLWAGPQDQPPAQQQPPATVQQEQTPAPPAIEQNSPEPAQGQPAPEPPPPGRVPVSLTLPAGTAITVRTSQALSSDRNLIGDKFSAELQQPVVINGWVVARRGQTVLGRVSVAEKAGRVKGVSQLGLELTHLVLVDGQQIPIKTELMQASGNTTRGRDASAIGTTTGLGAIIGAAAGEGKGAAIGAGAGAAAGILGVLLTRGEATVIPPEESLTFETRGPVIFSTLRSAVAFRPVEQSDYASDRLERRPRLAGRPGYPPPPFYSPYYPWGYYYPTPFYFGFGYYGRWGRFHR
jgi:hypothetical protein